MKKQLLLMFNKGRGERVLQMDGIFRKQTNKNFLISGKYQPLPVFREKKERAIKHSDH